MSDPAVTGVEGVAHLGIFDTRGTFRAKRLGARAVERAERAGWSFIDAIQWWDSADGVFADLPFEHAPVRVDPASERPFPFEPGARVLVGDFEGPVADLSPRRHLERAVDALARHGLRAQVAWEFETIVLDQTSDQLAATGHADLVAETASNRCWTGLTPAVEAEFFAEWVDTLEAGGIAVDHVCCELGPGCYELALAPEAPVRSADGAAFAKLWTRALCARDGRTATFMAQLDNSFPGLGGHPTISLHDGDGTNVTAAEPGRLSPVALHAVAGVLACLGDLMCLFAPTVNSYRRYAPGNWAPRTATWGIGNYTCGLRAVVDDVESARLEFRLPGADTAPHLCAAMVLLAAEHGIAGELPAPPPTTELGREVVPPAYGPLPRTLLEATDRFAASPLARKLLGDPFVDHYAAALVAEDEVFRREVSPFERARYLDQV